MDADSYLDFECYFLQEQVREPRLADDALENFSVYRFSINSFHTLQTNGAPIGWGLAKLDIFQAGRAEHIRYLGTREPLLKPRAHPIQSVGAHHVECAVLVIGEWPTSSLYPGAG